MNDINTILISFHKNITLFKVEITHFFQLLLEIYGKKVNKVIVFSWKIEFVGMLKNKASYSITPQSVM